MESHKKSNQSRPYRRSARTGQENPPPWRRVDKMIPPSPRNSILVSQYELYPRFKVRRRSPLIMPQEPVFPNSTQSYTIKPVEPTGEARQYSVPFVSLRLSNEQRQKVSFLLPMKKIIDS